MTNREGSISRLLRLNDLAFALLLATALAGCGGSGSGVGASDGGTTMSGLSGSSLGSGPDNPIIGSAITFYAVGSSGYGSGATQLATGTSNSLGSFTIGSYTCPAASPAVQTYITAVGGDAGSGPNSAIGMMALTGPCNALTASSFVIINELTTVAAQWGMAQFIGFDGAIVGTSSTNATGLQNAVSLTMSDLVASVGTNVSDSGVAAPFLVTLSCPSPPTAVQPINCVVLDELDTLANVVASCINSSGSSSMQCQQLFCGAAPGAIWNGTNCSVPPPSTDTLAAVHEIVTNPALNVGTIFGITPPPGMMLFAPALTSMPDAWTLALNYAGGGLNLPFGIAIDSLGSAWITNLGNHPDEKPTTNPSFTVSKFSPTGTPLSGTGFTGGGISNPAFVAVDGSNNAWIGNLGSDSVTELDVAGNVVTGSPFTGGGIIFPTGIALDKFGNIWVANNKSSSITKLTFDGTPAAGSPFFGGGLNNPIGLALDSVGNVWIANNSNLGGSVSKFDNSGTPLSPVTGYTGGGVESPFDVATTPTDNVWVTNTGTNAAAELKTDGSAVLGSPFTGGGINTAAILATDSASNVWLANFGANSVSELDANGAPVSPVTGFTGGGLNMPTGVAVDPSGNLWIVNNGDGSNSITEFIGAAAPVKTPINGSPMLP